MLSRSDGSFANFIDANAEVSLPLDPAVLGLDPGLAPEEAAFSLTMPIEVAGEVVYVTVDKMRYEDGRLFTNTCPFRGVYDKDRFVSSSDDLLQRLAQFLYAARNPLFITGAGMSADSGLPTYRGVGGLYESGPTAEGISIEIALSGPMLLQRPELAWKYLWQIGSVIRQARPNRGHEVLAAIEREKPRTWVLTQNIDGFHQGAGSRNVIEIHGHLQDLRCVACGYVTGTAAFFHPSTERPPVLPPRCPDCGSVLRPSVVMFGEALPVEAVRALSEVVFQHPPDLVIVIGTTAVFPYIELPVREARERQVPTFEINPHPSAISDLVDGRVSECAARALDRLWRPLAPPRR